jgi:hypothetical protein
MPEAGPPLDASTRLAIQQEWPTTFGNSDTGPGLERIRAEPSSIGSGAKGRRRRPSRVRRLAVRAMDWCQRECEPDGGLAWRPCRSTT